MTTSNVHTHVLTPTPQSPPPSARTHARRLRLPDRLICACADCSRCCFSAGGARLDVLDQYSCLCVRRQLHSASTWIIVVLAVVVSESPVCGRSSFAIFEKVYASIAQVF